MTDPERWLPYQASAGAVRLYCLPHAGGSASAFRSWIGAVPGVSVRPVQPPGREGRHRETPYEHMRDLVADLAEAVLADVAESGGGPYAVYGHSLGAMTAYELVRRVAAVGGPAPVHLLVSGCGAPELCGGLEGLVPIRQMTQRQIAELLRRLGGTPEWLLDNEALLNLVLPPFKADFTVKENYRYVPAAPLTVPVTAVAATDDPRASVADVAAWEAHTSAGFVLNTLMGGHFAALEQADLTRKYLASALAPWR
ncbi:thioesterase II family protein [Streptomyces sp. NPDC002250]|uniref:thioesterase II family protein n=1 Tax=Streptomyces sp. NPDC002250 TaxID=3364641 RepID=UPI0036C41C76